MAFKVWEREWPVSEPWLPPVVILTRVLRPFWSQNLDIGRNAGQEAGFRKDSGRWAHQNSNVNMNNRPRSGIARRLKSSHVQSPGWASPRYALAGCVLILSTGLIGNTAVLEYPFGTHVSALCWSESSFVRQSSMAASDQRKYGTRKLNVAVVSALYLLPRLSLWSSPSSTMSALPRANSPGCCHHLGLSGREAIFSLWSMTMIGHWGYGSSTEDPEIRLAVLYKVCSGSFSLCPDAL